MKNILIDCGTSFLKIAIVDVNGDFISRKTMKSPLLQEKIDHIISVIWEVACSDDKINVVIATEMHGFILTDKDGNAITDYMSWTVECDEKILHDISKKVAEKEFLKTGMPLKAGIASTNLYELLLKNPELRQKELYFYTLGDYIIRKITKQMPNIHPTNAAATGLYDLELNEWSESLIQKMGFENIVFPDISEGETIRMVIGNTNVSFYEAIGDQQAALLGAGISETNQISINMGTGSQISTLTNQLILSQDFQTRPFFKGQYLLTIPHIPCGRALNVFFNFFKSIICQYTGKVCIDDDLLWEIMMNPKREAKEENLVVDLSFFSNACSARRTGRIDNLGEHNLGLNCLMDAVLEQMADNYKNAMAKIVSKEQHIERVIFSGGVALKNPQLRERIAEKIGISNCDVSRDETFIGLNKYINFVKVNEGDCRI